MQMNLRGEPLRRLFAPGKQEPRDPSRRRLKKGSAADAAASGAPAAGRSSVDEALSKGPIGALQLLGPGLVTGASDDDPSGIGTYSQVGSQFGYGLLWTALFTFPLMVAVQELCARIALHTGEGMGVALKRKFPMPVVVVAAVALCVANTINVGADLGAIGAGGALLSRGHIQALWLLAPAAALMCVLQLTMSYAHIFRIFKWLTLALFAYVFTVVLSHPPVLTVLFNTVVPNIHLSAAYIAGLVAVLGTTISPYLFFWQASSEVDEMKAAGMTRHRDRKGVTSRELRAARVDVTTGMAFSQLVMYCIIVTSAAVLHAHGVTQVQSAQQAASALQPLAGPVAFIVFSVGLIGTGLLAIPVLAASSAYSLKEVLGFKGTLADKARYRPTFYLVIVVSLGVGVGINLLGINPIQALFFTAVINGILAPPLLVLITLIGSDKKIMSRRVSSTRSRVLTWIAAGLMGAAAVALLITSL